jgi:hypothetical protein
MDRAKSNKNSFCNDCGQAAKIIHFRNRGEKNFSLAKKIKCGSQDKKITYLIILFVT